MKAKSFFFKFLFLLAISIIANPSGAIAQKEKQSVDKKESVTFCDDYIASTKTILEKRANTTCNTAKETVPCNDRKTGIAVHVTLVVQPDSKGCPNTVKVVKSVADAPLSRGTAAKEFSVEVVQEQCADQRGVTLTAYIPGFDATEKKKVYDFEWMDNGEVIDSDRQVDCITGDKITLKVTNIATEQVVIRSITPNAGSTADRDYKVFGFEKTPCFGTCPVYKVAISKNGKATWKGISNVKQMGAWEASIGASKMKEMKEAAFKANYFDLSRKYPIEGEVADASTTITYFRSGDTEFSVVHTFDGPDQLVKFEEYLEKTITNLNWKRVIETDSK